MNQLDDNVLTPDQLGALMESAPSKGDTIMPLATMERLAKLRAAIPAAGIIAKILDRADDAPTVVTADQYGPVCEIDDLRFQKDH